MRYKIRGFEVRSENSAKPACLAGAWMLNWISGLKKNEHGLDLGCGKLRYTAHLASALGSVAAVDSRIQVERQQILFGSRTTIREYAAKHLPNVDVYATDEPQWQSVEYMVVLCSNVLSAIPHAAVRKQVVATAFSRLAVGGTFLLTTQFKNSHFAGWESDPRAIKHGGGFLVNARSGASFYGLMDARALTRLCASVGFTITDAGHAKELAYVLSTK